MNKKLIALIILAAVTLAAAAGGFFAVYSADSQRRARTALSDEINSIGQRTETSVSENERLQEEINTIDTELSTKDTINNYYMEYKKTHDDLTNEIEELKKQSAALDDEISARQAALVGSEDVKDVKRGKSYSLKKGETYDCTADIPEGRYNASGQGTLTILNSSGKARVSQNLDVAYANTYTFNIYKNEKIKVTGDVTLTELK